MKSCHKCISYLEGKGSEENCCLVEKQAKRRGERHIGTILDALTVNYFKNLLESFEKSKEHDDAEYYGERCFFYVEESQIENVG